AQLEPASGEIVDQRARARIAQHALHLLLQHARVAQLSAYRCVAQLVVRDAAPQEKGEARGEIEIAEAIRGARRQPCGLALDAEEKARRRQDALAPWRDAGIEAVFAAAGVGEAEELLALPPREGRAIRARSERQKIFPRAGFSARRFLRTADEYLAAHGRVACATPPSLAGT